MRIALTIFEIGFIIFGFIFLKLKKKKSGGEEGRPKSFEGQESDCLPKEEKK